MYSSDEEEAILYLTLVEEERSRRIRLKRRKKVVLPVELVELRDRITLCHSLSKADGSQQRGTEESNQGTSNATEEVLRRRAPSQSGKRRRSEEDNGEEMKKLIEKVTKTASTLRELIKTTPNTQGDIKKEIMRLNQIMESLNLKIDQESTERDRKAPRKEESPKSTTSVGVQVNFADVKAEMEERESKESKEIIDILDKSQNFEQFAKLLDRKWPERAYRAVKHIHGAPPDIPVEDVTAIIADAKPANMKGLLKEISGRHPEISEIMKGGVTEGQLEYFEKTTKINFRNKDEEKSQLVYILPIDIDKNGVNNMKEVHKLVEDSKRTVQTHGRKKITFIPDDGINKSYVRKILGYVFNKADIEVKLMTARGKDREHSRPWPSKTQAQSQAVIVKKGGRQYADLLKTVKQNIDLGKIGVKVRNIRETARGDLLLNVEGGGEKADSLKKEIAAQLKDVGVSLANNDATVHISDIDPTVTEEEIEEAIYEATQVDRAAPVKVFNMRPTRDGNRIATVRLSKHLAKVLSNRGKLMIGWVACRVRERIAVTRCYRCLEFGHTQNGCTGRDRSGECLSCGKMGHKAKDCQTDPFCSSCQEAGHRSDSTRCPKYRRMVEDKAKRRGSFRK
ncbi:unnamed protein product [Acanthoscelides obtectus]|uniref:CCHC-type domain-containing protein n=1 Tax=Acanthoscelides obtectus TaxID=200917 RepID=A0A9P0Q976_ACAOB|nr:unnamed protein product [Acanthoscelides obtectus]CAK1668410.1 Uncharacterized 50 kDa protein in type I retrotransposable element R1DM [Acanthoscelides obtectus]